MPEETEQQANEMADVLHWRRREALEAGLTRLEANLYAESEIPAAELRRLVELHCPRNS